MLEEVELHIEDVHVKYDGIISKVREIKDQTMRIEDYIVSKKNRSRIMVLIYLRYDTLMNHFLKKFKN